MHIAHRVYVHAGLDRTYQRPSCFGKGRGYNLPFVLTGSPHDSSHTLHPLQPASISDPGKKVKARTTATIKSTSSCALSHLERGIVRVVRYRGGVVVTVRVRGDCDCVSSPNPAVFIEISTFSLFPFFFLRECTCDPRHSKRRR